MEIKTLSDQEVQKLRNETTGTATRIHFNNAGASLPPDVVVDSVIDYLKEEAMLGGYETEYKYQQKLANVYTSIARLINAENDEIAIVENASTAWAIAFNGISFDKGDEIITCEMEYVTNVIGFIHAKEKYGITLKIIPNDGKGNFSIPDLEKAITPRTKLIAMTHIPSTAGGMIPIIEIGKIAKKHNIFYLVDACQSVGQLPLNVKEINCDMLSVTGRKYLRAPRGTGFLFVKKHVQDKLTPTFVDGFTAQLTGSNSYLLRPDARRFELYEKSRALTLGLGKAVDYAQSIGVDRIWVRIQYLAALMRAELRKINDITVCDFGDQQCGIITFTVKDTDSLLIKGKLAEKNINVSVGQAYSTLYYMNKNHLTTVVRASVHYYNTEAEIEVFISALQTIVQ